MGWKPIRKSGQNGGFNLADYEDAVRHFSWRQARAQLDGLPGGRGLNIAYEAVDRHAAGLHSNVVALRCVAKDGSISELTYADLTRQTSRSRHTARRGRWAGPLQAPQLRGHGGGAAAPGRGRGRASVAGDC